MAGHAVLQPAAGSVTAISAATPRIPQPVFMDAVYGRKVFAGHIRKTSVPGAASPQYGYCDFTTCMRDLGAAGRVVMSWQNRPRPKEFHERVHLPANRRLPVVAVTSHSRLRRKRIRHPRFTIGERVSFLDAGLSGTGVVDAMTGDHSIVWIWADGGLGRRMFFQGCGSIIASLEDQPE